MFRLRNFTHVLLALPFALAAAAAAQDAPLFDADGYRSSRFRAPVTIDPRPAPRLALAAALTLDPAREALFLDVTPVEGGLRDAATGRWRLSTTHATIPGAQWHPEVGRTPVDPVLWQGFENAVRTARKREPGLPVIVFCRIDCWMSWNASRRLATGGMTNVWWLAEGTDGWHTAGGHLVDADPTVIAP